MKPNGYRTQTATKLDATFQALADPTRRAILKRLTKGDATVLELAKPFAMTQPAISKHIKVLERAGLVSRSKDAQRRPVKLEVGPLEKLREHIDRYREAWEKNYQRLDRVLEEMQRKKGARR